MLGTVLCCPGCFSLYRCEALRDVLKEFATPAKGPFEYLSKDLAKVHSHLFFYLTPLFIH